MTKKEERFYHAFRAFMLCTVGIGLRCRSDGLDHIPSKGGFLLVGNHRSWTDPLLIAMEIERPVHFLAASFNFNIPIASWVFKNSGVMALHVRGEAKNEKTFRRSIKLMQQGEPVGIFPEGVQNFLNPAGEKVKPFQTGFVRLALAAGVPVVPVAVAGKKEVITGRTGHPLIKALLTIQRLPPDAIMDLTMMIYTGGIGIVVGEPIPLDDYYHLNYTKDLLNHIAGRVRREVVKLYDQARELSL